MSKALNFSAVVILIGFAQSVMAFDAVKEVNQALARCNRAPMQDVQVIESWGSGYEGYGCQTSILATKVDGQQVYISAYLCGDYSDVPVSEVTLRFTSARTEPRQNSDAFFTSYFRNNVSACN